MTDYAKDFPFQQNPAASASRLTAQVEKSMELKGKKASTEDKSFWEDNLMEAGTKRAREHRVWLWDGMIPAGEVTLVTGPGGCGKTSLMMKLAGAIWHRRGDLDGVTIDPEAAPVTLVTVGEQSASQLQELAITAGAGEEEEDGFVAFYHQVMDPALGRDMFWDAMKRARQKWPNSLFLVDSASSCLRVETDSADSVRAAYGQLREVGGTWAVLHHNNKDKDRKAGSVDKVRGSTAWVDGCDRLIVATPEMKAVKLCASRRGDPKEVTVALPWQITPPEEPKESPEEKRAKRKSDAHEWMDENKDFCVEATGEAAWKRYEADGGTTSRATFFRCRKNWCVG